MYWLAGLGIEAKNVFSEKFRIARGQYLLALILKFLESLNNFSFCIHRTDSFGKLPATQNSDFLMVRYLKSFQYGTVCYAYLVQTTEYIVINAKII